MIQPALMDIPAIPLTTQNTALMTELLNAIAAKDHAKAYDCIDLMIDRRDMPCRGDGGYQPRKGTPS